MEVKLEVAVGGKGGGKCSVVGDLASSLRLSGYLEAERALNGSVEVSICRASANRLFLSNVAHSRSQSSLWSYINVVINILM